MPSVAAAIESRPCKHPDHSVTPASHSPQKSSPDRNGHASGLAMPSPTNTGACLWQKPPNAGAATKNRQFRQMRTESGSGIGGWVVYRATLSEVFGPHPRP